MSPATTASKVLWHFDALAIAYSIILKQRRVSASSQLVPNPVDHVKSRGQQARLAGSRHVFATTTARRANVVFSRLGG